MELSKELMEKAKTAKNARELLTLAKENGVELTENEARITFHQLSKSGELSDEELDNVSGGGCGTEEAPRRCPDWDAKDDGEYDGCNNCSGHKLYWADAGGLVWDCEKDDPCLTPYKDWSKDD